MERFGGGTTKVETSQLKLICQGFGRHTLAGVAVGKARPPVKRAHLIANRFLVGVGLACGCRLLHTENLMHPIVTNENKEAYK